MAKKTYNINELLEKKKSLEKELVENAKIVSDDLVYEERKTIDFKNAKNNKVFKPREKVGLANYVSEVSMITIELSSIKTAIAKHNSTKLSGLLQKRESLREQHTFLTNLREKLKGVRKVFDRQTERENDEGEALEITEITKEPMFDIKEVGKMLSNIAEQERQVNTEIQKINLSATISL